MTAVTLAPYSGEAFWWVLVALIVPIIALVLYAIPPFRSWLEYKFMDPVPLAVAITAILTAIITMCAIAGALTISTQWDQTQRVQAMQDAGYSFITGGDTDHNEFHANKGPGVYEIKFVQTLDLVPNQWAMEVWSADN